MAQQRKKGLPRLTLEKIRAADDIKQDTIDVPEWGGSVVVRGATKAEFDKWLALESPEDAAYLLSATLVEPSITQEEAAELRQKSAAAVGRIEAAVTRLSSAEGAEQRFLARN